LLASLVTRYKIKKFCQIKKAEIAWARVCTRMDALLGSPCVNWGKVHIPYSSIVNVPIRPAKKTKIPLQIQGKIKVARGD
jgi:hypothetical protein